MRTDMWTELQKFRVACLVCTGFVEEMRFVAMRLHTKDQAPKEGGQQAAPQPFQKVCICAIPHDISIIVAHSLSLHLARGCSAIISNH